MSLVKIAGFLIALGVLFVIMAGAQQKRGKDPEAKKLVPIPPEGVQILSILCFIAGFGTLAYAYYTGNVGW